MYLFNLVGRVSSVASTAIDRRKGHELTARRQLWATVYCCVRHHDVVVRGSCPVSQKVGDTLNASFVIDESPCSVSPTFSSAARSSNHDVHEIVPYAGE